MKTTWMKSGNKYFIGEDTDKTKKVPVGVYHIGVRPDGALYLNNMGDRFEFPYKVYGVEQSFIDRIPITYNEISQNLGILLNGIKGTGKSVTAKLIANKLELPVIVVDGNYDGLIPFLNQIQQEVVIFFDEYEKIFEEGAVLLTVMDGIHDSGHKRVFLLTTNSLYINSSMLMRPGRIRYLKTFEDLDSDTVEEIIDDLLLYPEFKEDCIEAISSLRIITIDLVKSIVHEVNIHNESPKEFMSYFNVKDSGSDFKWRCDAFQVTRGVASPIALFKDLSLEKSPNHLSPGMYLRLEDYSVMCKVVEKIAPDVYKVSWNLLAIDKESVENYDSDDILVREEDGEEKYYLRTFNNRGKQETAIVKIVEQPQVHHSYKTLSAVF